MPQLPPAVNPERLSSGTQFYICLSRAKHLDGLYTIFARVINGEENMYKLRKDDRIIKILFPRSPQVIDPRN